MGKARSLPKSGATERYACLTHKYYTIITRIKHPSLVQTFRNYKHKKFLKLGFNGSSIKNITLGWKGKHCRLLQKFINYEHKKFLTMSRYNSNITNIALGLKSKHSSLLQTFVNYRHKLFCLWPWWQQHHKHYTKLERQAF